MIFFMVSLLLYGKSQWEPGSGCSVSPFAGSISCSSPRQYKIMDIILEWTGFDKKLLIFFPAGGWLDSFFVRNAKAIQGSAGFPR